MRLWLLTDELLELPQTTREPADVQHSGEERLEALTGRVDEIAETERRMAEQLVARTAAAGNLVRRAATLTDDVGMLKGYVFERRYHERAAYFSRLLRRIHALSTEEVPALLKKAETAAALSRADRDDLPEIHIVRRVSPEDNRETYSAVEASRGIRVRDAARAASRARLAESRRQTSLARCCGQVGYGRGRASSH